MLPALVERDIPDEGKSNTPDISISLTPTQGSSDGASQVNFNEVLPETEIEIV